MTVCSKECHAIWCQKHELNPNKHQIENRYFLKLHNIFQLEYIEPVQKIFLLEIHIGDHIKLKMFYQKNHYSFVC